MKMEYKLLDNGTGIILTRQPEFSEGELIIEFVNAPSDATAVFDTRDGNSYYRPLSGGMCSLPIDRITDEVKVTVALMNGGMAPQRWLCEEFKISRQKNGGALIAPNDMNLPQAVTELRMENEELRAVCKHLEKRCDELRDMLEKVMEGYDFT